MTTAAVPAGQIMATMATPMRATDARALPDRLLQAPPHAVPQEVPPDLEVRRARVGAATARTAPVVTRMALWMLSRFVVLQNTARSASPWSGVSPIREAMPPTTWSRPRRSSPSPIRHHPTASTARRRSGDRRTTATKQARAKRANGAAIHPQSDGDADRACRSGCSGRCRHAPASPLRARRRPTFGCVVWRLSLTICAASGTLTLSVDRKPWEISAWSSRTPAWNRPRKASLCHDEGHHLLHDRSIRHGQLGRRVLALHDRHDLVGHDLPHGRVLQHVGGHVGEALGAGEGPPPPQRPIARKVSRVPTSAARCTGGPRPCRRPLRQARVSLRPGAELREPPWSSPLGDIRSPLALTNKSLSARGQSLSSGFDLGRRPGSVGLAGPARRDARRLAGHLRVHRRPRRVQQARRRRSRSWRASSGSIDWRGSSIVAHGSPSAAERAPARWRASARRAGRRRARPSVNGVDTWAPTPGPHRPRAEHRLVRARSG